MKSFAALFGELRQKKGLSVQETAKRLKVNPSTISRWENGLAEPSWSKISLICKVFGVSVTRFAEGISEE